jgi:tRNA-splicing ligase RtcB (3'-phosphate/5'-hydroxy nucleic acid ligase)
VKKVISTEKAPIKMWLDDVEEGAIEQAKNLANLPFALKHIALMPDCHQGYGMPIGGILATKDVVIPNAVGVDIGCGVACCKLPIKEITVEQIKKVFGGSKEYKGGIRSAIPVGRNHHSTKLPPELMPKLNLFDGESIVYDEFQSARKQIGTLGGGNHFIEIQKGSDEHIYIMIHSGSRNLGFKVANHYNKIAKELNAKWFSSVDPKWDLAFLPVDSNEGQAYISEMKYCVEFAKASRRLMMDYCLKCFEENNLIKLGDYLTYWDVAHNYAALENHFGQNVWVHRKGATKAYVGEIGVIPGSQGTSSFIVKGLGNPESFKSCSHGAGRLFSRTKAKETLNLEEEIAKMDSKGIVHGIRHKNDLDEASSAYKNIDDVMTNQSDLVEIVTKLTPLGVIKG